MTQVLESQDIRALGSNLELLAQQVVEGFIVGLHRSPFHGFSVEFAEHRLYNPGESTRNIDWKVYGRTDKLFVKKFEEETNLRCHIVIDASSTMYYPWEEKQPLAGWFPATGEAAHRRSGGTGHAIARRSPISRLPGSRRGRGGVAGRRHPGIQGRSIAWEGEIRWCGWTTNRQGGST